MTSDTIDLQYFQEASEDTEDFKMKRRFQQPFTRVNCALCTICASLLVVIMVLAIFRYTGDKPPDHTLEYQIGSLNNSMNSKVDHLAQDEAKMVEILQRLDNTLQAIHADASTGSVKKPPDHNIEHWIRNLSDSINSKVGQILQDGSKVAEKLQQLEDTVMVIYTDASKRSNEKPPDRSLEYQIGNLSDIIKYKVTQLTQDGSTMMEKLQQLDTRLTAIQTDISIGSDEKPPDRTLEFQIGNLTNTIEYKVTQLTQDGSTMMEKLQQLETRLTAIQTDTSIGALQSSVNGCLDSLNQLSDAVKNLTLRGSEEVTCPPGWRRFGGSCYFLFSSPKSWTDSKKTCEEKDSHLAVINTEEEQDFITGMLQAGLTWIGLTDEDGDWKWVDGTSFEKTPKFWESGQPDNWSGHNLGGGEDCGQMRKNGKWNDDHCSISYPYICEKNIS